MSLLFCPLSLSGHGYNNSSPLLWIILRTNQLSLSSSLRRRPLDSHFSAILPLCAPVIYQSQVLFLNSRNEQLGPSPQDPHPPQKTCINRLHDDSAGLRVSSVRTSSFFLNLGVNVYFLRSLFHFAFSLSTPKCELWFFDGCFFMAFFDPSQDPTVGDLRPHLSSCLVLFGFGYVVESFLPPISLMFFLLSPEVFYLLWTPVSGASLLSTAAAITSLSLC